VYDAATLPDPVQSHSLFKLNKPVPNRDLCTSHSLNQSSLSHSNSYSTSISHALSGLLTIVLTILSLCSLGRPVIADIRSNIRVVHISHTTTIWWIYSVFSNPPIPFFSRSVELTLCHTASSSYSQSSHSPHSLYLPNPHSLTHSLCSFARSFAVHNPLRLHLLLRSHLCPPPRNPQLHPQHLPPPTRRRMEAHPYPRRRLPPLPPRFRPHARPRRHPQHQMDILG
jgi:hypothetical protein